MSRNEYAHNLKSLVALKPFIDDFFNNVMVMAEDKAIRKNRAALLNELGRLMNQVADISKLAAWYRHIYMKLIILDRDGVINQDSDQFIKSPDEWKPLPGTLDELVRVLVDHTITIENN